MILCTLVSLSPNCSSRDTEDLQDKKMEKRMIDHQPPTLYGSMNGDILADICPTCRGIGRIPRGHAGQLVAVIPCSDQRLKPRHTKLSVCFSVALCLLICCLILFFLFPRTITILPVSVQSVMVHFTQDTINMEVTNLINITNENFLDVKIHDLSVQVIINQKVMKKIKISNITVLKQRSQKSCLIILPFVIDDSDLNIYCKSSTIKIHTLFLHLQMTMNVSYLGHTEQLSKDAFEYVDCGANTTIPHPIMS